MGAIVREKSLSSRTFAIIGGTLWGNKGAEAMVSTTVGRIRDRVPDASFLLLSYYPAKDRELAQGTGVTVDDATPRSLLLMHFPFALLCWPFRRLGIRLPDTLLPGAVRRLRRCAALLDVSGISFHDGRLAIVAYNVFCIWPALLLGVPVIRLSQAMGPFRNPLNRLPARWFMSACRHSFARGRFTAEHMAELGLPAGRWSLAPDVAFSFVAGDSLSSEGEGSVAEIAAQLEALKRTGTVVVAVSPSSVVLGKSEQLGIAYVGLLLKAAAHLQGLGHHLLILPNATRAGAAGGRNNDLVVIEKLKQAARAEGSGVDPERISWVEFDVNTDGIRKLVGLCDLLVTSRFHAMVAALALSVPVFVIGWSHKYEEVLEQFGCADAAIDFSDMEGLIPALDRALAERAAARTRIEAALPEIVAASRRQFEAVDGKLA